MSKTSHNFINIFCKPILVFLIIVSTACVVSLHIKVIHQKRQIITLTYQDSILQQKLNNCSEIQKQTEIYLYKCQYQIDQTLNKYAAQNDSLENCAQNYKKLNKQLQFYRNQLNKIRFDIIKIYKYSSARAASKK